MAVKKTTAKNEPKDAKPGEFIFDQNGTEVALRKVLLEEVGIEAPSEWKRAKVIQQLKVNNGKSESAIAQTLEDAGLEANEAAEKSLDESKADEDGMVTIRFPVKAKIKIAINENDQNDFIAGLNGVVWQVVRGKMAIVPWGLIVDMTSQTVKRSIAITVNGKTEYVLQETPAHPDISIYEIIYGTRTLPKELADALQEKGDLF